MPRAELVVVDPPQVPNRREAFGVPIAVLLAGAALIGLVLAAVLVVLRSIFDRNLRDREDVERVSGLRTLGPIRSERDARAVGRTALPAPGRVLLVSGTDDSDAAAATAAALAAGLSTERDRWTVVTADEFTDDRDGVVVACPSILSSAHVDRLAPHADAIVLVVPLGVTSDERLRRACALLPQTPTASVVVVEPGGEAWTTGRDHRKGRKGGRAMTLRDFAGELRRRWKLFATIVVVCALAAVLLALLVPNRYTSSIRLLVTSTGSTTSSAYESLQLEAARTRSYVTLVASDVVAQRVVDDLGLSESAHDVASGVNGVISADTNIIDVTVTGDSPEQATAIADSLGRQFVQYSAAVETPVGSDDKKVVVRTLGPATPATTERPGPLVFGVLGGLIGVVIGAAAVWIRSRTDRVVRRRRDAEAATGLRVFGPVGTDPSTAPRDAETYRALAVWTRAVARLSR